MRRIILPFLLILILSACTSTDMVILQVFAESSSPDVVAYEVSITQGDDVHESGELPVTHRFITTGLRVGECKVIGTAYDSDGEALVEYGYDIELRKGHQERLTLRFQ